MNAMPVGLKSGADRPVGHGRIQSGTPAMKPRFARLLAVAASFGCGLGFSTFAAGANSSTPPVYPVTQAAPPAPPKANPAVATAAAPPSAPAENGAAQLEALVRPIALHPDPLLAVILPASVYPLEIVQAARFIKDTNNLAKVDQQPWDDKVKAVAKCPEVIASMDADIAWTTQLGQAFLNQPMELMNAIQTLRGKAQANGALKTTPQQVVTSTNAVVERLYEGQIVYVTNTVIEVQPASTNVVYVPSYNPSTVYVDDDDDVEAVIGFGVALGMTAIIANNCDWHYGGCYWGHYPPPPYRPPPGTPPPTGGRPPGTRPPTATTLPAQRWQPDQSRLNSAGAPATAQSREARGWGSAGTQPAPRPAPATGAARPSTQPAVARQPATSPTRAGSTPNATRTPTPWTQSSGSRPAASPSTAARPSASPSFNRQTSTAFSGVSSGGGARSSSNRGATSRGGGGGGGGGRRR